MLPFQIWARRIPPKYTRGRFGVLHHPLSKSPSRFRTLSRLKVCVVVQMKKASA
jgi:hypothetical protein